LIGAGAAGIGNGNGESGSGGVGEFDAYLLSYTALKLCISMLDKNSSNPPPFSLSPLPIPYSPPTPHSLLSINV